MHKVDIQPEQKEAVATEARKNREKQRQSQIFNVRNRVIGVDIEALKNQVQERKRQEDAKRAQEAASDATMVQCDLVAQMLEKKELQNTRKVAQQVQAFREWKQRPQDSRDFNVYDPESLRKKSALVGDLEPFCLPSSEKPFAGKDSDHQYLQREQYWRELNRQREERCQARKDQKYAETLDEQKLMEMNLQAAHLENLETTCRKATNVAVANYNKAKAKEEKLQRYLAEQREQDDNITDICNHLASDILTEKSPLSSKPGIPHGGIPERWKGMSPEQLAIIRNEQMMQRMEALKRQQDAQCLEAEWTLQEQLTGKVACQLEHEQKAEARKLRRNLDNYNKKLAGKQQEQKKHLDKVVYTNEPTARYYSQFNTSSR